VSASRRRTPPRLRHLTLRREGPVTLLQLNRPRVRNAINRAMVAGRTLFGSDRSGPGVPGVRGNIEAFRALPLSDRARSRILSATAVGAYRW